MLKGLPFHSFFKGGTEGGKRTHDIHHCLYFGHSARSGGWKNQDPITSLFSWYYILLQRCIEKCRTAVNEAYESCVKIKFKEALAYNTKMKVIEAVSTKPSQLPHKNQGSINS